MLQRVDGREVDRVDGDVILVKVAVAISVEGDDVIEGCYRLDALAADEISLDCGDERLEVGLKGLAALKGLLETV